MTINLFFILSISFFAISVGDPLCGPESCQDLGTVKTCNNVKYCIEHVWSQKKVTGARDNVCNICLEMVKEARDQLQSNETMTELKEVLEGSCKLMPIKVAANLCIKLVDEFIPELVQLLLSQMDPEMVCTVAKLCNNEKLREEQMRSNECFTCQKFIVHAADVALHSTESHMINQFVDICRSLGSYSDACMYNLLLNSSFYIDQTRTALLNKPCEALGLCPTGSTQSVKFAVTQLSSQYWQDSKEEMCSICPRFVKSLKIIFDSFKTDDQLVKWTYDLCMSLFLSKENCQSFAFEHHKLIYSYLNSNTSYEYICGKGLGLCIEKTGPVPVWPLIPSRKLPETSHPKAGRVDITDDLTNVRSLKKTKVERVTISYGDPLPEPHKGLPIERMAGARGGDCQACFNMFSTVTGYLDSHQDFVNYILNTSCSEEKNYDKCAEFVKTYGRLFQGSKHTAPEKVCPILVPFCDGKPVEGLLSSSLTSGHVCRFCKYVFHSLNSSAYARAAEIQVTSGLKETCGKVLLEEQSLCNRIAENFLKNIISVTSEMNSSDTCSSLKLCEPENVTKHSVEKDDEYCKLCMIVVQTAYYELRDYSDKEEVREILRKVCEEFPSKARSTCETLIDKYGQELIHYITENLSPADVCKKIELCTKINTQKMIVPFKEKPQGSIPCNLCLTVLKMLINQLHDNETEESIKKALDTICTYMPEEVRDTCKALISQYTEDIVDMIIADFNSSEICIYLKICGPRRSDSKINSRFHKTFSIATNEIWKNHIHGACHFCQLMERSMAVRGYEDKGAEGMFGLLADVCMMDVENLYGDCAKKFSEEILPYGKNSLLSMTDICENMKLCPKDESKRKLEDRLLQQIRSAVQECAMCEAIVEIVSSHVKKTADGKYEFAERAPDLCMSVPFDRKKMCESMLVSYAPSIVGLLIHKKVQPNEACFHVKLCDQSMQTKVDMPVTSLEQSGLKNLEEAGDCLKGPSFWCANLENAKKCGTLLHCQEVVWKGRSL